MMPTVDGGRVLQVTVLAASQLPRCATLASVPPFGPVAAEHRGRLGLFSDSFFCVLTFGDVSFRSVCVKPVAAGV